MKMYRLNCRHMFISKVDSFARVPAVIIIPKPAPIADGLTNE